MDRIRELQSQLKTLYEKDTSHRLSERSCVSIILKLIAKGELSLLYTQDGKEYITQEQLGNEIKRELNLHGGRINIVELPPLLNVDTSVIEEKVKTIASRNIHIHQGALLSSTYLEGVAKQIEAMLQERGSVTLIEMVTKFQLGSQFLTEMVINRHIGSTIHGVLDGDILYTETFLIRYKHTIRGIFHGITQPTPLSKVKVNHQFHNQDLFESTLGDLISSKELYGYIEGKGNRATYMPYLYVNSRKKWIHNFLSQNGHIDYEMLQKLQISSPVSMMSTEYADEGIALSQCFVSRSVLQDVEASVTEFIDEDKGWLDIKTLFEFHLPTEDIIHILDRLPAVIEGTKKKNTKILFIKTFLVTNGFLRECLQKYLDYVKENPSAIILPSTENQEDDEEEDMKSSGKSRGKKFNRKQQPQSQKKKQSTSKGGKTKEEVEREISANLLKWFSPPNTDSYSSTSRETSEITELFGALAVHLRPTIESACSKISQAVFRDTYQIVHKDKLKVFPGKMNAIFLNILLFDSGIQSLQNGTIRTSLSIYLLSTLCRDLFHLVLENQAILHQIALPPTPNTEVPGGDTTTHFTSDDVVRVLALVPEPVKTPLKLMNDACNGQMLSKFIAAVDTVVSKIDCPLKKLDKKSERQLLFQHRQDSITLLQNTTDPVLVFHLILSIIHIRQCQVVLYVDPSNPGILLELLKNHVSVVIYKKLQTFWECVQEFKKTDGNDNELRKVLENHVIDMKKFALEKIDLEKYQE